VSFLDALHSPQRNDHPHLVQPNPKPQTKPNPRNPNPNPTSTPNQTSPPQPQPQTQGDDYILYCHPSKQKVPRSDRLRGWYHEVLRRAREEGTVVGVSTLFDSYFEGGR